MVLYIIGALALGIFIGRITKNMSMERAAKMNTVLHWDGELYTVKKVEPKLKTDGIVK